MFLTDDIPAHVSRPVRYVASITLVSFYPDTYDIFSNRGLCSYLSR